MLDKSNKFFDLISARYSSSPYSTTAPRRLPLIRSASPGPTLARSHAEAYAGAREAIPQGRGARGGKRVVSQIPPPLFNLQRPSATLLQLAIRDREAPSTAVTLSSTTLAGLQAQYSYLTGPSQQHLLASRHNTFITTRAGPQALCTLFFYNTCRPAGAMHFLLQHVLARRRYAPSTTRAGP